MPRALKLEGLVGRVRAPAVLLMSLAGLLLLAGWFFPELWRPAFAERRPLGFALLGLGALLMWLHARQRAQRQQQEALSSLTHVSLAPYEFAPVTLPMEEPTDAAQTQALLDEAYQAPEPSNTAAPAEALIEPTATSPTTQWTVGLLRALEWRRFEAVCEEIFKQDGYVTRSQSHDSDSGADIWLHSRLDLQQPVRIVQCRNWSSEPVGVAAVREFLGAMVDIGLRSGALLSCGAFTPEAEAFARRNGITLVNGPELLALIRKRPDSLQRELLNLATQGDYSRPTCRRCGRKMEARGTTAGGSTQWMCPAIAECKGTLEWNAGPA